jgi:hypothetical protein
MMILVHFDGGKNSLFAKKVWRIVVNGKSIAGKSSGSDAVRMWHAGEE